MNAWLFLKKPKVLFFLWKCTYFRYMFCMPNTCSWSCSIQFNRKFPPQWCPYWFNCRCPPNSAKSKPQFVTLQNFWFFGKKHKIVKSWVYFWWTLCLIYDTYPFIFTVSEPKSNKKVWNIGEKASIIVVGAKRRPLCGWVGRGGEDFVVTVSLMSNGCPLISPSSYLLQPWNLPWT